MAEHEYKLVSGFMSVMDSEVPESARLAMAINAIGRLASLLKIRKEDEFTKTIEPVNIFSLLLLGSGLGKDRSLKATDSAIQPIIQYVEDKMAGEEYQRAERECIAKEGNSDDVSKYIRDLYPLTGTTGTPAGLLRKFRQLSSYSVGGATVIESELSASLSTVPTIFASLKTLAELYDSGRAEANTISGEEVPSKPVENASANMILFSDPFALFYDKGLQKKFNTEMTQRFARRTFFTSIKSTPPPRVFKGEDDFNKHIAVENERYEAAINSFISFNDRITNGGYASLVKITKEVRNYIMYNANKYAIKAHKIPNKDTAVKTATKDVPWRAVNLAVAFAGIKGESVLTKEMYDTALHYSDRLNASIKPFYTDMNKEAFEHLADFIASNKVNPAPLEIRTSDIVKTGIIQAGISKTNFERLLTMTRALLPTFSIDVDDTTGILKVSDKNTVGSIPLSRILFTKDNPVKNKLDRANKSKEGYKHELYTLQELSELLSSDCAYVPFNLRDGILLKDNIISGTKAIIFDIDDSEDSMYDVSDSISDISHVVSTTSDPDNIYKFRVIIELERVIYPTRELWMDMCAAIAKLIGLTATPDRLHQTQASYGYAGSKTIVVEAEPLSVAAIDDALAISAEKLVLREANRVSAEDKIEEPKDIAYHSIASRFIQMVESGNSRHYAITCAVYAFKDLTDDIDWIFDVPIKYINVGFRRTRAKSGLDDEEIEKMRLQHKG